MMLHRGFIEKQRVIHGIVVNYQWVNGEPALCLMRRRFNNRSGFAICLSAAYQYTDVRYLMMQSVKAAAQLGMHNERFAARQIADIIIDGLPDLVAMKPEPKELEELREGKRPEMDWDDKRRILTLH